MKAKDKFFKVVSECQKTEYAFPFDLEFNDEENSAMYSYNQAGMTLTDYFAAQYMAAGKLPDEAFRLARLAMKERDSHG